MRSCSTAAIKSARAVTPSLSCNAAELLDRDGTATRTAIASPTANRRQPIRQVPCTGFEHEAEPFQDVRIGSWRWAFEKRPEICIGTDLLGLNERSRAQEYPLFQRVPRMRANRASCESVRESGTEDRRESAGIETLAFQSARLGRRLFWCLFRFSRQIGRHPITDTAFEGRRAIALTDQIRDDVGVCDLVRVGVVNDDLALSWQRQRTSVAGVPHRSGQANRTRLGTDTSAEHRR